MSKLKIVFMGTPEFALPVLKALYQKHQVLCVYCQPPRPAGRGQKVIASPVQQKAEELGIPVRCPLSLKGEVEQKELAALGADIAVVAAYGMILPEAVIRFFPKGCINVHASLLPRWRGASPIQSAILAGDDESGVSIMKIVKALDAGDYMLQKKLTLTTCETAGSLHDKLSMAGADAIVEALDLIAQNKAVFTPQDEAKVTYAAKINKEDAKIDFTKPAIAIERMIRAYNPSPRAWFLLNGEIIKVNLAQVVSYKGLAKAGDIIGDLTIVCGQDAIKILELQRAGKTAMDSQTFLRGIKNLPIRVDDETH